MNAIARSLSATVLAALLLCTATLTPMHSTPTSATPACLAPAVDVRPEMVAMLQTMVRQSGLTQTQPLLDAEDDVEFSASSVDLAVIADAHHALAFPYEVLAGVIRAVKPGGQPVFIAYRAEDPQVPIKALHKINEAQIKRETAAKELVWDCTVGTLPCHYLVVF